MTASNGRRELWLVRHGETPASRGRTLAGWSDVPLTEHGEDQACALQEGLARFEGFAAPGAETFADLRARVLSFLDGLPAGRHLVFTHRGVVRLLSREVGEDRFVPTGTLLVVDWDARRLLARRDGEGEASKGLPTTGEGKEER